MEQELEENAYDEVFQNLGSERGHEEYLYRSRLGKPSWLLHKRRRLSPFCT
jgi:hypothetical protein